MRSAAEILRGYGLPPSPNGKRRYYVTCPKCSSGRSREHQRSRCLGVTIGERGVHFGCSHCSWKGGAYYDGKDDDPIVATYNYQDETGTVLFQKVRTKTKKFWARRPDGRGGWVNGINESRRVLYRLPEIIETMANERLILIVEGEKDVDNLWRIGAPATCNFDGAAKFGETPKWRPEYSETLRNADIVVILDHDEAGYAHADAIASMLIGIAKNVRTLKLAEHWADCLRGGDISDWLKAEHTREALDALIERAVLWTPAGDAPPATLAPRAGPVLIVRNAGEIEPEPIEWVWPGRIAIGKHTTIAGDPGVGKSQAMIFVVAAVTTGGELPGGEGKARMGNVIILSAEDGVADIIVPRLMAAGADLSRVTIVTGVRLNGGNGTRTVNFQADLELLRQEIRRIGNVALVCVDPISSYLGKIDSHKNAELRSVLEPVGLMADEERVAVLSVTHLSKGTTGTKALYRFIGSIAFTAAPRAAFLVTEDPEDKERRLLLLGKTNLGKAPQGLAFRLVQRLVRKDPDVQGSYVEWDADPITMTADEAIAAANGAAQERSALEEAVDFLQEALAGGPRDANDVEEEADAHCISARTLRRARKQARVVLSKKDFDGGWQWRLFAEGGQGLPKVANSKAWPPSLDLATFGSKEPDSPGLPASLDRRGA
jgi:putative DNA primase/helicase